MECTGVLVNIALYEDVVDLRVLGMLLLTIISLAIIKVMSISDLKLVQLKKI